MPPTEAAQCLCGETPHPACPVLNSPACCHFDGEHEIEVVELEDENGDKEEFAVLDELDFEGRHFCIMAPLAEVQAFNEKDGDDEELNIEIFEVKDDDFTLVEDEALAARLLKHLDELASQS